MKTALVIVIALFLSGDVLAARSAEAQQDRRVSAVLESAETFFMVLRDGQYEEAWKLLSEHSCERIIDDVYKASEKVNASLTREKVAQDFENRGSLFQNYWSSFRNSLNPDAVLDQSRWEMGAVKESKAEILIWGRKADRPARLQMFREKNIWKLGLVETFWKKKFLWFTF
jgi:hypothetical protein